MIWYGCLSLLEHCRLVSLMNIKTWQHLVKLKNKIGNFVFFSQSIPCLFIDTICKTERIASVCLQFIIPDHILGETQVNTEWQYIGREYAACSNCLVCRVYSIYTLYTECIAGIEMARLILDVYECTLSVCSVCILQQHIDGRAYTGCILSVYYSGHIGGCGCGCIHTAHSTYQAPA